MFDMKFEILFGTSIRCLFLIEFVFINCVIPRQKQLIQILYFLVEIFQPFNKLIHSK